MFLSRLSSRSASLARFSFVRNKHVAVSGLQVDEKIYNLVQDEILPGTPVNPDQFWDGLSGLVKGYAPKCHTLLEERDAIQGKIDDWHRANALEPESYKDFLTSIGYILPEPQNVTVSTANVDSEIGTMAGPQLVVPINNARYALNAANARWGSLYDALYGTNIIPETDGCEKGNKYNPTRGAAVVAKAAEILNEIFPLSSGSHSDVVAYSTANGKFECTLSDGTTAGLADPSKFVGHNNTDGSPSEIWLVNNNLHMVLHLDKNDPIGAVHPAGLKDVEVEAAVSTIMDCEDSVAAVDAEDKAEVYRNWLGLMKGDLSASFMKGGSEMVRKLNADKAFESVDGQEVTISGRSQMLIRHVGHHMMTDIVTIDGQMIPEGFLDAMVTCACAHHDGGTSRTGSMYVVKPKQHGPSEVALTGEVLGAVENALSLAPQTLKMGIMDEERRTSVNLKACIAEVTDRVVFINTGFLDRTGDDMHTAMLAGPSCTKGEVKKSLWLNTYEDSNVDAGLSTGLNKCGQIGKGMWAAPDEMAEMLAVKGAHLEQGATTSWVPSPTAATLHALHYHQTDVSSTQAELSSRTPADRNNLLVPALMDAPLSADAVQLELDLNAQSVLGYVVRWVDQGIGCSKVPDLHGVGLMEDRATLRISSQLLANWLQHGVITEDQLVSTFERVAAVVDEQNSGDALYKPMAPAPEKSTAYQAALELILQGTQAPNGYTEYVLHKRRREAKAGVVTPASKTWTPL